MAKIPDTPQPPDEAFIRQRFVHPEQVRYAQDADRLMVEHGAVGGSAVYRRRHEARWRAQKLIRLMVDLRLHERWELTEHVERKGGGWKWAVHYVGRHGG